MAKTKKKSKPKTVKYGKMGHPKSEKRKKWMASIRKKKKSTKKKGGKK